MIALKRLLVLALVFPALIPAGLSSAGESLETVPVEQAQPAPEPVTPLPGVEIRTLPVSPTLPIGNIKFLPAPTGVRAVPPGGPCACAMNAAVLSFMVPGTGQVFLKDQEVKGGLMLGLEIALVSSAVYFMNDASSRYDRYRKSEGRDEGQYNHYSRSYDAGTLLAVGTGVFHMISAFDAYFSPVQKKTQDRSYSSEKRGKASVDCLARRF
jgi:hypothetical protein